MVLTVVVVNYNTAHLLPQMFAALERAAEGLAWRCVVIDNASRDGSVELLRSRFSQHTLIENRVNVGFGRANNQALPLLEGRYVLLLNTDAFVSPDALHCALDYMDAHPRCGILGAKLVGRDGSLQPSCRYFPTPWNLFLQRTGLRRLFPRARLVDDMAWDHAAARSCDWVPGCYYLVRREVIDEVGLFDPRFFLYYEEVDHCRAARRAGWEVVFFPGARVVHLGGESAKSDGAVTAHGSQLGALQVESELLYLRKHHGLAGVSLAALLSTVAEAASFLRRLLRRRAAEELAACVGHARLVWSLLARTRWGTQPTR
jgi:GT2 family glycosyltransferase